MDFLYRYYTVLLGLLFQHIGKLFVSVLSSHHILPTKSLTFSDNSDRCHQSVDDNDQFYPSSHVARSNSSRVSHNHARTDASLQREYPGSLSLVSPGHSDFRQARDTFADQSSRGHEDDMTGRLASPHS